MTRGGGDVAVGAALGMAVVFLGSKAWEWVEEKPGRDQLIPIAGAALGWFLERRFVRFSMDVSAAQEATRCGVGFLLILLYETAVMPAVTGAVSVGWIGFVLTFAELMLLMVIYPLCFSRPEGKMT